MDIFYINLLSRTDRRAAMERQFGVLGLHAIRIEATTPADLAADQRGRYSDPSGFHDLAETELCCTLSHLSALRIVLAGPGRHAAIFEDDVVLSPALPRILAAIDEHPPASDLIRLETDNRGVRLEPESDGQIGDFVLRRAWSPTSGTAGYIVNRIAAQAILISPRVLQVPFDHALFNPYERLARQLRMRHLEPALCVQWDRLDQSHAALARSDVEPARRQKGRGGPGTRMARLRALRDFAERELWVGPQQLYRRLVHHAEKRIIALHRDT